MIGYEAGFSSDTDNDNTFIGFRSGFYNDGGDDHVFVGNGAGFMNTTGNDNVFIGEKAGIRNTDGDDNTFIGNNAGGSVRTLTSTSDASYDTPITGDDNTGVGANALLEITTGFRNTAVGNDAGYDVTTGYRNTMLGDSAGTDLSSGHHNTFVGSASGPNSEYPSHNTFVGSRAGWDNGRYNNTGDANRNTYLGSKAGETNRSGEDNVMIGALADFTNVGSSSGAGQAFNARNTAIGANLDLDGGSFNTGANDAVMLGYNTYGNADEIVAIGTYAEGNQRGDIMIGFQAADVSGDISGTYKTGIGYQADVMGQYAIGMGYQVDVDNQQAISIGGSSHARTDGGIAIGYQAAANASGAAGVAMHNMAIGYQAKATDVLSVAIGKGATASGEFAYAIGTDATAANDRTMVLGGAMVPLSVGIGTNAPNQYASLELADPVKGLLINRLSTAQRTALGDSIGATEKGMMVYDMDLAMLHVWDGSSWGEVGGGGDDGDWVVSGNDIYHATSGNVGIGTSAPSNILDIEIGENSGGRISVGDPNSTIAQLGDGSSTDENGILQLFNNNGDETVRIFATSNSWINAGNLGIGTSSPAQKLHIGGVAGSDGIMFPDGTTQTTAATDAQDLSLSGNTLSLTNDGTPVDLSGYVDNIANDPNSVTIGAGASESGSNSVTIGAQATTAADNAMALGYQANVSADNTIAVGNGAIKSIGGDVNWTATSDGRFKNNINEDVVGLDFILNLRPVTYNMKPVAMLNFAGKEVPEDLKSAIKDKEQIRYTGFIAQEVEEAALALDYDFSGLDLPQNDKDAYGLRYAEFVVPLVKAVQEQQDEIEQLKAENEMLKAQSSSTQAENEQLKEQVLNNQIEISRIKEMLSIDEQAEK